MNNRKRDRVLDALGERIDELRGYLEQIEAALDAGNTDLIRRVLTAWRFGEDE